VLRTLAKYGKGGIESMSDSQRSLSRKEVLTGIIALPAFAGLLASATTTAEAKGSKAQFKYQSHPNGTHKCSGCRFFHASKSATAMGTCDIVSGAISPNGWCTAFSAK
jgi:hypothetical protein